MTTCSCDFQFYPPPPPPPFISLDYTGFDEEFFSAIVS